jgi:predicted extracellular nuclease
MLRLMGRVLAVGLLSFAGAANAQVVISQVYGGGGNTGATYTRDFVELFNRGSASVALGGLTVQYASGTGTGNFALSATLPSVNLAPGQYYLVALGSGANGAALPTPDVSGSTAMSGTSGKVILANSTTALACNGSSTPCSGPQLALIVDLVGYGGANFFEGSAATPAPGNALSATRIDAGCTDSNQNGTDFVAITPVARNTASPLQSCGAGGPPLLAISDTSVFEGDSGTTTLTFGIGLNAPAGVGGVSIEYTTADGTATAASDYVATSGTATIAEGATSTTVGVTINGDTTIEASETLFLRATSATGATIGDGEGLGTIQNDDVTLIPIAEIQGSGLASPLNGAVVSTEGIVTAQKFNNGFFLQTADGQTDANPATSEGIFVFTSTAPPATAAVGNRIRVTGTVTEFTPATNLNQLSITEIVSVTSIQVIATGVALPAPVELTSADFGPTALPGTAERLEGMRVSAATSRAVASSDGNITESSATSSTTGVFHVVVSGVARPFRETGIGILDVFPIPGGKNPPRFDTNQERLMVRSRGQVGATAIALDADAQVNNLVGVLDYFSGTWALLPDASAPPTVVGGKTPTPVTDAGYEDVTVGAFNLLRFFDEVNDSNGAPTLTAAALDKRLTKTSLAICSFLKTPDILGVVEVENLRVLGLLADRINSTCASAPAYVPYLVQGNDVGGINVGFLVSARSVGSTARVEVVEVTQFGKTTLLTNPDLSTSLLNDRPPLMLRAIVKQDNGASFPITAFINHLRSLNGIDDSTPGSSGWATESERVRAKRAQQAVYLANLVETRQQADPGERIVLLGDFNAFEFSDGYADVMGIIRGDEAAEPNVLTYAASPITAPLIDGSELIVDPAERYSYVFAGNAQTLDHVVVNEELVLDAALLQVDHARINADFGEHNYGVAGNAIRVSDHDPVRLAISVADFRSADLSVTAGSSPATVAGGGVATFTATVGNAGPNAASFPSVGLVFNALVSVTVTPPSGWTCAAPVQAGGNTSVSCTATTMASGTQAAFSADVTAPSAPTASTLQMGAAVTSQTADRSSADNSATASVAVQAVLPNADLGVRLIGGPVDTIPAGGIATMVAQVRSNGPSASLQPTVAFTGNVPGSRASVIAPAGWSCAPSGPGDSFSILCTAAGSFASGSRVNFTFNVTAPNVQGQPTLEFRATTGATATNDPVSANNSAGRTVTVTGAPATIPVVSGGG